MAAFKNIGIISRPRRVDITGIAVAEPMPIVL